MNLPVHNIIHSTTNGPGNRIVIWVQGCSLNCKGCFNPETHETGGASIISVADLANMVNNDDSIEGITISGGEPLDYPIELTRFLENIKPNLTKIAYSGYSIKEISKDILKKSVIKNVDLAIVGRFNKKFAHPYLGKKFLDVSGKIDLSYFKLKTTIEYSINKHNITKTGIF